MTLEIMALSASGPMLDLRTVAPQQLEPQEFKFGNSAGHCEAFPAQFMERTAGIGIFAPTSLTPLAERLGNLFADSAYQSVPVILARLENATVDLVLGACCTSDGSLVTEAAFVPRAIDPEFSSSGFPVTEAVVEDIQETVLHCFHRSAPAFGHYLNDCLPIAALLLSELIDGRMRLLVPPYLPDWAVRGLQDIGVARDYCIFPRGKVLRCRRLVLPSTLDTSSTFRPHPGLIAALRAALGPLPKRRGSRRLWLSRLNQESYSHRRLLNEKAVQDVLAELGFEMLEPGNLPLRAQIEAFASAEIVAGVHGSAFGNLIFAAPGVRVVDLMPDAWIDFWGPSNTAERWLLRLTTALDLNYAITLCPSDLVRVLPEEDRSGLQRFGMDCRADLELVAQAVTAPLQPPGRQGMRSAPLVTNNPLREDALPGESTALITTEALEPLFRLPERQGINSAWWGHVPFAGWIMRAARPRVFVELGTFSGVSYVAFCQAALADRTSSVCHAVDTWYGDPHAGIYDNTIYLDFKAFHDTRYKAISQIHRCTFDEAQAQFDDGSVDLLHIDGYHTYEAVKHDFETWLPKLSRRGVVLFHDTNEHHGDFGVWRFWDEISTRWPSFSFLHSHGLGVVCVGAEPPPAVLELCVMRDPTRIETIRQRFALLGDRWDAKAQWEACLSRATQAENRATQSAERILLLEQSVSWRITAPLRLASSRFPWVARQARRAARFARKATTLIAPP